jgi:hypothetical protein
MKAKELFDAKYPIEAYRDCQVAVREDGMLFMREWLTEQRHPGWSRWLQIDKVREDLQDKEPGDASTVRLPNGGAQLTAIGVSENGSGEKSECDGCGRNFLDDDVCQGPMLQDEVWAKIAKKDEDLCAECVLARAPGLAMADLLPCPFNLIFGPSCSGPRWFLFFQSEGHDEWLEDHDEWLEAAEKARKWLPGDF